MFKILSGDNIKILSVKFIARQGIKKVLIPVARDFNIIVSFSISEEGKVSSMPAYGLVAHILAIFFTG